MRALVVGADGFAGRWLLRHLHEAGDDVAALVGPRFHPPLDGATSITSVDVREHEPMAKAIADARPEAVYYLAAVSAAGGRERIADAARIGLVGAIHALTACAELGEATRFVFVSSAHVYGDGHETPIGEAAPMRPTTIYGAAKAAGEQAVLHLASATAVEVVVARAFNHVGPGQAEAFVVPSLASQIRPIPAGGHGVVRPLRLDSVRDFTDVRDVVRAYRVLALQGERGGAYNVASGRGTSVIELIELLAEIAHVTVEVQVGRDEPDDGGPSTLIGDASRLQALGWSPQYDLRRTLQDVLSRGS